MLEFIFRLFNTVGMAVLAFLIVGGCAMVITKIIGFYYEALTGKSFKEYLDKLNDEEEEM